MNKLHKELIEIISKNLCIYDYCNISKFMLINNEFSKYIKYYSNILDNTNETIHLATKVKCWRSEIDQSDYIYDSFILFDDISYFNNWEKNTKCIHTNMNREYKEIIVTDLYSSYITPTLYNNRQEETKYSISYNYLSEEFFTNIEYKIDKFKFDIYFIYYFATDLNCFYAIHFLILPYYDCRMKNVKDFHSYNVVKKNTVSNHNITKVDSIEF